MKCWEKYGNLDEICSYSNNKIRQIMNLKDELRKYQNKYGSSLSIIEQQDMDRILDEIKRIQGNCTHKFETIVLFNIGQSICKYCDFSVPIKYIDGK